MYGVGISFSYLKLLHILDIGKKATVWKSANFDGGLYDITAFGQVWIISMYLQSSNICPRGNHEFDSR